ncbi:MAG: ribosome maturation factor RimP [Cytophagaceae bacterium]
MKEIVTQIVNEAINNDKLFLVDVQVSGTAGNKKIRVIVDGDEGVGIDDCSLISRRMDKIIEEKNLFDFSFTLEVSSPGVDQPLILNRQFKKNIGRRIIVMDLEGKEYIGKLEKVTDTSLTMKSEVKQKNKKNIEYKELEIPFERIKKSNVLVSFK